MFSTMHPCINTCSQMQVTVPGSEVTGGCVHTGDRKEGMLQEVNK